MSSHLFSLDYIQMFQLTAAEQIRCNTKIEFEILFEQRTTGKQPGESDDLAQIDPSAARGM